MNELDKVKEELMKVIEKELQDYTDAVYRSGYEEGRDSNDYSAKKTYEAYLKGINDAWECAEIISNMEWEDLQKAFHYEGNLENILLHFTASEAMQKIKDYEERKTEEIKVGDEVYDKYNPYPRVVASINEQDMADLIDARGNAHSDSVFCIKKTGRHFPQIAEVLEQMRKESHD